MAIKAVFLDYATVGPGLDTSPLTDLLPGLEIFDATQDDQVLDRIRGAEFVIANKTRISKVLIDAASELRFIGLTATGTDNIDLDSARRHGVAVCNIRSYCSRSVTEHVFGVLLMLAHNLHNYTAATRDGSWQKSREFCMHTFPVRELSSMTMGIVGFGELGRAVAHKAREFDMEVIVSAHPGSDAVPDDRVAFEELLERADVTSLHCPLSDTTRGLFGASEFKRMKSTAFLINTARGGLVDSSELATALRNGDIAAAAVDVLPEEPPVNGDPLLDYDGDNLLVTPHIAWSTDRARQDSIIELAANIEAFIRGEKRNRVV